MAKWNDSICWLLEPNTTAGYVETGQGGVRVLMHRLMYRLAVGPLIDGLEINHLCKTRNCVNPKHLEQVSHGDNVRYSLLTTICGNGHEWTPENTYVRKDRNTRQCRACTRESAQRRAKVGR